MEESTHNSNVTLESLDQNMQKMGKELREDMNTMGKELREDIKDLRSDFTDLLDFLKETMVTKSELQDVRTELKTDIADLRTDLKNDVAMLQTDVHRNYTKLDEIELELNDIKRSIARLEAKTQADDDAIVKDIVFLKKRVAKVEHEIENVRQQRQKQPS